MEAVEVVVLKELILNMAGIGPVENLSEGQITALTCGPTVAIEALASSTRGALQARPLDRPAEKLMAALVKNDLAVPLLILLAQHRQSYVYRTHNASLKTLSSLYDEVRPRISRGAFYQVSFRHSRLSSSTLSSSRTRSPNPSVEPFRPFVRVFLQACLPSRRLSRTSI
jgi:hypothetical protein